MEQAYAQALLKLLEGGEKPAAAVKKLHRSLEERGRLALLPKIANALKRAATRERERTALTVSVAKSGSSRAVREAKELLKAMHIDAGDIETKTDETLIGGWRLEGREHLYDASYKRFLLDLYERVIHS